MLRCDSRFPGFGEYIFPQLQICTALVPYTDSTEGSCSSIIVSFDNFLVFNLPFFQIRTIMSSSLNKYSSIFDVVTTLD